MLKIDTPKSTPLFKFDCVEVELPAVLYGKYWGNEKDLKFCVRSKGNTYSEKQ